MGCNIGKIRQPGIGMMNALAVIDDFKEMLSVLLAAYNSYIFSPGINTVFSQFRNGFQGIGLGKGDNGDCIPVVPDAQLSFEMGTLFFIKIYSLIYMIGLTCTVHIIVYIYFHRNLNFSLPGNYGALK